jgi:hypothetical protein
MPILLQARFITSIHYTAPHQQPYTKASPKHTNKHAIHSRGYKQFSGGNIFEP